MTGSQRIRSISRLMAFICWIPIIMTPALILFGDEQLATVSVTKQTEVDGADSSVSYSFGYSAGSYSLSSNLEDKIFSSWGNFLFAVVRSLPSIALFVGFLHIRRLFLIYSTSEIFSVAAARHMKWFSVSLLVFAILRPLAYLEKDLFDRIEKVDTFNYYLEIPDADVSFLFLGLSLLVISWAMGQAARLAEDNRSIV